MNNYIKRIFFLCAIPQKSVTLQQNYMAVKLYETFFTLGTLMFIEVSAKR